MKGDDDGRTLVGMFGDDAKKAAPSPDKPRIGNRYEVLDLLGAGGMGTVYRVRDVELDEIVALKRLKSDLLDTPGMLGRFRQEVKLARRVSHTNVVRTFDLGEDGTERYLTMEFVDGPSLGRVIARGPMPIAQAVAITRDMCAGIGAAHAVGVMHRDLKPENVLLEPPRSGDGGPAGGRVVITDFGLARHAREAGLGRTLGPVGTPSYMAPEQVQGGDVDARADLYAVGAVLYELLTGERAWQGTDPFAIAFARLSSPPPDPRIRRPSVPVELAEIVLKAMARAPGDRYRSATELAAALALAPHDATNASFVPRTIPIDSPRPSLASPGSSTLGGGLTVAVLPFSCAGSPDDQAAAEALTDELRDALSATRGMRVRTASQRPPEGDVRAAGLALGVEVVVDGSVRRVGEQLRVVVRLVHVADGYQIAAHRYDVAPAELAATSDTIVREIATALGGPKGTSTPGDLADPYTVELYTRARQELKRSWNTGPSEALALLRQAVGRAPDHPEVLALYALACARCTFFGGEDAAALALEARTASERAVLLAAGSTEAWTALATICWNESDMPGAGRALRRAVALSPSNARAQEMLGMLLLEAGRPDEAIVRLQAAASIDSDLSSARSELIRAHALLGRWSQVDRLLAASLPANDAERFGRAMATARLSLWRPGEPVLEELPDLGAASPSTRMALLFVQMVHDIRRAGRVEPYQRQLLLELEPPSPSRRLKLVNLQMIAELFGFAGEVDLALQRTAAAVAAGLEDLVWMDRVPCLAPARADPRWDPLRSAVKERADRVLAAVDEPS